MDHISDSQKRALSVTTLIALVFGAYFLRGYFSIFIISSVVVYLFWPVYLYFRARTSSGLATLATFAVSTLSVILPLTLVVIIAVSQMSNLVDNLSTYAATVDLSKLGESVVTTINNLLANITFIDLKITEASLIENVKSFLDTIGGNLLDYARNTASSVFGLFSTFILYIFLFISLIQNGPKLVKVFRDINPLGPDISDLYLSRTAAMVRGTVRGQFIIAVVQGFLGALALALAGLPGYFFIFWIIFSAFSVIPLGSGILTLPLGALFIMFGNTLGGLIIIIGHLFVTTNADNLLRPRLVPREARLDPALMLVSVFAGITMFGFLGIIIGPTLMVLIVTTVQVYLDVFRDYDLDTTVEPPRSLHGIFRRFIAVFRPKQAKPRKRS